MPKASRRLSLAVGEAGANIQGKSESEAANLKFNQVRRWALNAEGIAKALSVVGEAGLTNKSLRAKRHRNYQKFIRNFGDSEKY